MQPAVTELRSAPIMDEYLSEASQYRMLSLPDISRLIDTRYQTPYLLISRSMPCALGNVFPQLSCSVQDHEVKTL